MEYQKASALDKIEAIKAAGQLQYWKYPETYVPDLIIAAEYKEEISKIMTNARKGVYELKRQEILSMYSKADLLRLNKPDALQILIRAVKYSELIRAAKYSVARKEK